MIIQKGTTQNRSHTLMLGAGISLAQTSEGLPEISTSGGSGEVVVEPSGGSDTVALRNAIAANARVRLAPGTFTVDGIIDVPAGAIVTGSGTDKTRINKTNYSGPVFRLGDTTEYVTIENLRIVGPGKAVTNGNSGIMASRGGGLAIARRVRLANLHIEEIGENALMLDMCGLVEIVSCVLKRIGWEGIYATGAAAVPRNSHAIVIMATRVEGSGTGVYLRDMEGAAIIGCEVDACWGSYKLNAVSDAVIAGCVSRKCENVPLLITGGANIVVDGFSSDNVGTPYFVDQPHLLVDGGALGVQINGFRRVNTDQPGALTAEANVSAAGGRVLVAYHNFTAGKINSAGKFADVNATALP